MASFNTPVTQDFSCRLLPLTFASPGATRQEEEALVMTVELLTVDEAARWAKVSTSFLNKARISGGGPKFVRLGRAIRYRQADLDAWVAKGVAGSTSEPRAGDQS